MNNTHNRETQERLTYEDTLAAQKRLLNLIYDMIENRPYFNSREERLNFMELVSRSFLGSGIKEKTPIVPVYRTGNFAIPLGKDIAHCALSTFMQIKSEKVILRMHDRQKVFPVQAKVLWEIFLQYCLVVFPRAQSEALHSSIERQTKGDATEGFEVGAF